MSRAVGLLKKYLEIQEFVVGLKCEQIGDFVEINWKKQGKQFYVYSIDVVYHKGRLTWFQSSEADVYRLCVLYEKKFGNGSQKCTIHFWVVDVWNCAGLRSIFHGDKFKLIAKRFAYQTYNQSNRALVSLLQLLSLRPIETIELSRAKRLGLEPELP